MINEVADEKLEEKETPMFMKWDREPSNITLNYDVEELGSKGSSLSSGTSNSQKSSNKDGKNDVYLLEVSEQPNPNLYSDMTILKHGDPHRNEYMEKGSKLKQIS